ncbi:hypothetical protein LZ575_12325 [Antarcticibacterium sp. 1MA-6-2]|uniref:hypothetical protein n=1 Tax=Antarcticibacterium sp. 1MA-6-2 TaxID=2908210 RepID=UPI001F404A42|nr:hypothetical protein [Antarcticibacterium sp. 1MA-6-2]UJH89804.1 hypothetical protein LZ575_12325 [Antarcticibacterium sp. 1MA-6-2]
MILKKLLLILVPLLLLISCNEEKERDTDLKSWIPKNSAYILKSNDLNSFLTKIDSLSFLKDNPHLVSTAIKTQLKSLSGFFKGPAIVSFSTDSAGIFHYTFLAQGKQDTIQIDTIKNKSIETFKYEDFDITKYTLEDISFFTSFNNEILIASNSRINLEKILTEEENNDNAILNQVLNAADPSKTSLLINHKLVDKNIEDSFSNFLLPIQNIASWSVVDIDLEGENIFLNGISTWKESEISILSNFKEVTSQPNLLATVTPSQCSWILFFYLQ